MVDVQKLADDVFASVKGFVASALAPLADRIKALEERGPEVVTVKGDRGDDGTSITVDDVAPLIAEEVARAVEALPPPAKGDAGADADMDALRAHAAAEARQAAEEWVKANPPKDGEDGKAFTLEEVRALVGEAVAVEQAKWALDFERRAQGVLERAVERIPKPKDGEPGKDALGFDDLSVEFDGERTFTLAFEKGGNEKSFSFVVPVLLDRGVFKEGTEYAQGDVVTWGGSMWIAQTDTKAKPGEEGWRLAVKKGRDGKDYTK